METSIFLARLMGPAFLIMGLALLVNRKHFFGIVEDVLANRALLYFAGLFALVPGLAIVLVHNVWTLDWRLIVTLIGWLAVIAGALRLLLPHHVSRLGAAMLGREAVLIAGAGFYLVLGAVLSLFGYVIAG
jgi:hypothetical protein